VRRSESAVAVIRREQDGQILWLTQWNPKWGAYHFVSGHRRPEESFRECLVREIAEELGLHEGTDYRVESGHRPPVEFPAVSRSAGVETWYVMQLFEVKLAGDRPLNQIDADSKNRWLNEAEIRAGRCRDGKPVSETMLRLLKALRP
jgi:8-oxo-dGTP pyrophosphatase MutT (NUDIX family)